MLKVRVIPFLTFNGLALVKTRKFANPRMLGNPVQTARLYNSRRVDELIFLDITASAQNRKINLKLVKDIIKECYMPVGIGGGIKTLEDINDLLKIGADKVILKTMALENISFIKSAVNYFGSQCISISVDVYKEDNKYLIHNSHGLKKELVTFIDEISDCLVGELVVNSVDNDGMMNGFDIDLFQKVTHVTNLPVIAVGGAGTIDHFVSLFSETNVNAVGASSIFQFTQFTPNDVKLGIQRAGRHVRL